jgi:hypothetical protein
MAEPPPRPEDQPEIADANWLLRDPPAKTQATPPAGSTPARSADPGEGYAVEGLDPAPADEAPPVPRPIPPPPPRAAKLKAKPEAVPEQDARAPSRPEASVDEVWTRWGEWGPNIVVLVLAGLAAGGLIFLALALGWFAIAIFLLLVAGAGLLALSYPIAITLERPVRMTPEQAVRDYYSALSHHLPHYRRMWLLLSTAGKTSRWFGSLEGFKAYWEERLATLKGNRAGKYTPLKFKVEDFKSEKSAGLTSIPVKYSLQVFIRGEQAAGPVANYRMEMTLVKGPDKMWYLNDGTIPADPA